MRLSALAARLVRPSRSTDGRGYRAWDARRDNQFYREAQLLAQSVKRTAPNIDELRNAAHGVAEYLADRLPPGGLPRGYRIVTLRNGERALAHGAALLNPSLAEPPADESEIARFAHDVYSGWLAEIEVLLGKGDELASKGEK